MEKKTTFKKLQLNKERIMELTAGQQMAILGGDGNLTKNTATARPTPKPAPKPTTSPEPITMQSRTEDCTIVNH